MSVRFNVNQSELKNVYQLLDDISDIINKKTVVEKALKTSFEPLLEKARQDAPEGPTGNLKDGIKSRSAKIRNKATTAGAIQFGVFAPHAYFISDGTGPRTRKSDGRYTGFVEPNPFWDAAYESEKAGAIKRLGDNILNEIENSIKNKDKYLKGKLKDV